jgi:hypothetical protein
VFLIAIDILPGLAPRKAWDERDDPALSARRRFSEAVYDTPGAVIFERRAGASLSEVEEVGSRG